MTDKHGLPGDILNAQACMKQGFDELDECWNRTESILRATHIYSDVRVDLLPKVTIYFGKLGSKRMIYVRETPDDLKSPGMPTPICELAVDKRIAFICAIPYLYKATLKQAQIDLLRIKDAVNSFNQILDGLETRTTSEMD